MGFISSSMVLNIVKTFFRKRWEFWKVLSSRKAHLWPSAVSMLFSLFAIKGYILCQDNLNVSRSAAVSRCVIGVCRESVCRGKRLPYLFLTPPEPAILIAHYLSDYDAPLSEAGDYTTKYRLLRNLFSSYHSECCCGDRSHICLSFLPLLSLVPAHKVIPLKKQFGVG